MGYNPTPRVAEILNWCLEKVESVPYKVTLRWIFYRAVQEKGLTKKDYHKFKRWVTRARKNFWNGWRPDTLVDDTRKIHGAFAGFKNPQEWILSFKDYRCHLDPWYYQRFLVMIWFEAEAMYSQFSYYTPTCVPLVPFKGDPSLDLKWKLARMIEEATKKYNKTVVILYYGDYDPKGIQIPISALKDIKEWCNVDFDFIRVGLLEEHVKKWNLPENPERPGEYQWEALSDEQAKYLIERGLRLCFDFDAYEDVKKMEEEATNKWKKILENIQVDFGMII